MTITCPNCATPDQEVGKFCENCGFYLESYSYTVRITRKLPRCGPLPATVEARLREKMKEHLGQ